MTKKNKTQSSSTIALNRKAKHDYFIEERLETGIVLEGWEVKSLRAGRVQISDSHVVLRRGDAWLLGAVITPLPTASTHINPEPTRTRKLLLHRRELDKLIGSVERRGYTIVPLAMYWKRNKVKVEIGLAKGKKHFDKRTAIKERDWQREKARTTRIKLKG